MHAEIIAIGDELTSGQRLDTNSQWLSQQLGQIGIRTLYHTTVGDDLDACTKVFYAALQRAELVIATGGLGPTADDLTRQAIADAVSVELELDESALAHIENLFAIRNRPMPEKNRIQAFFPKGSTVIPNPHGTAPGIDLQFEQDDFRSRLFALPGVPAEMKEMWEQTVFNQIQPNPAETKKLILHHRLKCFGVGESQCESMLPDLIRRGREPSVGITVHRGTITLRVTAHGNNESECRSLIQPTLDTIHECLGSLVFGEEDDELEHVVFRLLSERKMTLSVSEWGTAGLVSNWLGGLRDSDQCFLGSIVVSKPESVSAVQGIHATAQGGTDSEVVAKRMAEDVRKRFDTDFGLSISALPDLSQPNSTISFAVATRERVFLKSRPFASHPDIQRDLAAKAALNLLRLHLTTD